VKAPDSFGAKSALTVGGRTFEIFRLDALERRGLAIARLPYSLKILLENLLRREDGRVVRADDIERLARWDPTKTPDEEIAFMPARVLLQDFTGVPAVVDLASMRDAIRVMGGDPKQMPGELGLVAADKKKPAKVAIFVYAGLETRPEFVTADRDLSGTLTRVDGQWLITKFNPV